MAAEFIRRLEGRKFRSTQEQEPVAMGMIQTFLGANYGAIRTMRALANMRQRYDLPLNFDEMREGIARVSNGALEAYQGALCVIGEHRDVLQEHDGEAINFGGDLQPKSAVRGFWFYFEHAGLFFECVDLDGGLSRAYFDRKSHAEKRRFVARFGCRRQAGEDIHPASLEALVKDTSRTSEFVAFIGDTGGAFEIETVVGLRRGRFY